MRKNLPISRLAPPLGFTLLCQSDVQLPLPKRAQAHGRTYVHIDLGVGAVVREDRGQRGLFFSSMIRSTAQAKWVAPK